MDLCRAQAGQRLWFNRALVVLEPPASVVCDAHRIILSQPPWERKGACA